MSDTAYMTYLGEKMRARKLSRSGHGRTIRRNAGLTLADIAQAVGVSEGCVSRWERGARTPTGTRGVRWVRVLSAIEADR